MANPCQTWCGLTLVASLVIGLVVLLAIYLIVRKLACSGGGGSTLSLGSNTAKQMSEKDALASIRHSPSPVVLMVYADWCGHCTAMKPDFIAVSQSKKAVFGLVNGDQAKTFAKDNDVTGYPCILKFKNGKLEDKMMGRRSKEDIQRFIE